MASINAPDFDFGACVLAKCLRGLVDACQVERVLLHSSVPGRSNNRHAGFHVTTAGSTVHQALHSEHSNKLCRGHTDRQGGRKGTQLKGKAVR